MITNEETILSTSDGLIFREQVNSYYLYLQKGYIERGGEFQLSLQFEYLEEPSPIFFAIIGGEIYINYNPYLFFTCWSYYLTNSPFKGTGKTLKKAVNSFYENLNRTIKF